MDSLAKRVSRMTPAKQKEWMASLSDEQVKELALLPWWFIGRPEQQTPVGELWRIWLLLTGRDWGKTRTGAENFADWVIGLSVDPNGHPTEWGIFAQKFSDAKNICVQGPSGILHALRSRNVEYVYNRSDWKITLVTGQIIHLFGADTPDVGRGYNFAGVWCDEIAKWGHSYETWHEGIMLALRVGKCPRAIITTTPKRIPLLRKWVATDDGSIHVTTGTMDENADNIDPSTLAAYHDLYDGTRTGRQEMGGELLGDVEGALWKYDDILVSSKPPDWKRMVIAVDPAVTNSEDSDETGIVVCAKGVDGLFYVLADLSCKDTPLGWAKRVCKAQEEFGADRVIYEDNQGGDVIATVLRGVNPFLPLKAVRAKQGKQLRAEPVASLYEQHKVFHVEHFDKLEDQMLTWDPSDTRGDSPDRIDALVHGLRELSTTSAGSRFLTEIAEMCPACQTPNLKGAVICVKCFKPMGE